MAKILTIIGIVAAIAGAIFTFMISSQQATVTADLDKAKAAAEEVEERATTLEADVAAKEAALTEAQQEVEALNEKIAQTETQLKEANTKLESTNSSTQEVQDQLATVTQEFNAYKERYSPEQIDTLSTQVTELNDKLASLENQKTQAEERVAELETLVADSGSSSAPAGQQPGDIVIGGDSPAGTVSGAASGINGRVQAVNAGWNFVVLNIGEADGITPNTVFDVYRDGSKVGSLKVSTIEPQISTANVVTNRSGIQPGDRVVSTTPSA